MYAISHLGVNQISASYVSKVAQELNVKVSELMEKTIDSYIPYLYVDASYFKARDGVKYVNKSLLVVVGVMISLDTGCSEFIAI